MTPRLHIDIRRRLTGVGLDVRLDVGAEVLVLFGPSGAGKSSILNAVAGLLEPDDGRIDIDGRTVFRHGTGSTINVPARERRVGYVFQDYALFPHLTAADNVAYPLRRGAAGSRAGRRRRAVELLATLGMEQHADSPPHELSGGQQQRVAIARALALDSSVLLLDEPFAALDGPLRERLQHDLVTLQRERDLSVIVVTHDLDDAFAVGQRLAVLRDGRIEQVGPVADVFRRPASNGVADVMGVRNILTATVVQNSPHAVLDWRGVRIELAAADPRLAPGREVNAYIRPEDVKVLYPDRPVMTDIARNTMRATVVATREGAGHRTLQVLTETGAALEIRYPRLSYASLRLVPGEEIRIALRSAGVVVLD